MWVWWIRPAGEVKEFKNILGFLPIVVEKELCKHEHFREVIEKLKEDLIKKGKKKILYYDCLTLILFSSLFQPFLFILQRYTNLHSMPISML
jgi:hypothetical protein